MTNPRIAKRKDQKVKETDTITDKKTDKPTENKPYKYGPMPKLANHRVWSRAILIFGILLYAWFTSKIRNDKMFARQKEVYEKRSQNVECDPKYLEEIRNFPGCVPKTCGRFVSDKIVTKAEADMLLQIPRKIFALSKSSGGASILDLHSGALSHEQSFVNIYAIDKFKKLITLPELTVYRLVRSKVQHAVADFFQLDASKLYLTHPTFFSRLTNDKPQTDHDEYWHRHVDKETYESFHYTTLLYLNDQGVDYKGGEFTFLETETSKQNYTIEPRTARVSAFTSGAENPHLVEKVISGERYAITISFTCDASKAIKDPVVH